MAHNEDLIKNNAESLPEDTAALADRIRKAGTIAELVDLAGQVAKSVRDENWLKRVYEKAADKVSSTADLRTIARSIAANLEDKEFEIEIYWRVLERTRSKEEYIMYAQLMAIFLGDGEFSQRLCSNIEAIFLPKRRVEEEYKELIDAINDLTPRQKMEKFAAFLKKFKMNKHIKDIYFKAAKEFANINKREALIAYLKYYQLSFRENSTPEPVPDRVKKSVFRNEQEYEAFMEVIKALQRDNDIGAALAKIEGRYRKRIDLDKKRIAGIKSQHAVTVDKLDELLAEEEEYMTEAVGYRSRKAEPYNSFTYEEFSQKNKIFTHNSKERKEEVKLTGDKDAAAVNWDEMQREFLNLFVQNDYRLSKQEAAEFARGKNIFESRLIDSINESFLDRYDDMLIEEEEKNYIINPEYRERWSGLEF